MSFDIASNSKELSIIHVCINQIRLEFKFVSHGIKVNWYYFK
jgi:hypothetical protein